MKLITALFILFSSSSFAQTDFVWSEVVKVDSASANEMFSRAKKYVQTNFKAEDITMDESSKSFDIKGWWPSPLFETKRHTYLGGIVHYHFYLAVKDGRYKYTIDECYHDNFEGDNKLEDDVAGMGGELTRATPEIRKVMTDEFWNQLKLDFSKHMDIFISHLKQEMVLKTAKASDW